jgi:hypothetical protein
MRTTLTLDDDVAAKLRAETRRSGRSFRDTVNETLSMAEAESIVSAWLSQPAAGILEAVTVMDPRPWSRPAAIVAAGEISRSGRASTARARAGTR